MISDRTCLAAGCAERASNRRPFCKAHWDQLPGKMRSSLSLSVNFSSPLRDDALARAANMLTHCCEASK